MTAPEPQNQTRPNHAATPGTGGHVDQRLENLSQLLSHLDEAPQADIDSEAKYQNQLIQVRLGIASSLFTALRIRHMPTSEHCLRVSLGCSNWCHELGLTDQERDEIEIAALLHDVGKIGVPDSILRSCNRLTATEVEIMQQTRLFSRHILAACCASETVLEIVENVPAWYDGSREGLSLAGQDIPLGARMIAIVDAFDSMTTDHVYRAAQPSERATAELFKNAGTQFDPTLVDGFANLQSSDKVSLNGDLIQRWLRDLSVDASNTFWSMQVPTPSAAGAVGQEQLYYQKLLESMHDGVIFVDNDACILRWNRGAERLTSLGVKSVLHDQWLPSLVGMRDVMGKVVHDDDCPVMYAIKSGTQSLHRLSIKGRRSEQLPVDLHVIPIVAANGHRCGATVLVRDATFEANLEERVQSLHEKATRDPLTGLSNRAEFDSWLAKSVRRHIENGTTCSLIICDIDHFKRINDTYGHQAGDEALMSFASLLQRFCRSEDLVGRYGGEEFVMVCEDCPCASAADLAEQIRREIAAAPLSELDEESITVSFGVTELQPGDTSETILRRADRALLRAKDTGRNRVIQLGSGMDESSVPKLTSWWTSWMRPATQENTIECLLGTNVPVDITVQKLRGFVADHNAEIATLEDTQIVLRIDSTKVGQSRRKGDRPITMLVALRFGSDVEADEQVRKRYQTVIHVTLRPMRQRDRRTNASEAARLILSSLNAYLMADTCQANSADTDQAGGRESVVTKARKILSPWKG